MTDRLIALARRIERQPWNRPRTDKAWVLNAMWNQIQLSKEIRRVPDDRER